MLLRYPGEAVDHDADQRPVAQPRGRTGIDAIKQAARATPLGQKGDWVVMAAWLVLLRSRLLLDLAAAQALASWLESRPQLGQEGFPRGRPEIPGISIEPAHQVDMVAFLWASMALFDDDARDADTGGVYRPPWRDLHSPLEARQRILAVLAAMPDGVSLAACLPAAEGEPHLASRAALRRRSAWASTLLAGLELARAGDIALAQEDAFTRIQVRPANADSMPLAETTAISRRVMG